MKLFAILLKIIITLFTAAVFLVLILVFLVKFQDNSVFAQKIKTEVLQRPILVELLNLNRPGDARYGYLDPGNSSISVILLYQAGFKHNEKVEIWLKEMILQTLSKNAQINAAELNTIGKGAYSDKDLNEIRESALNRFGSEYGLYIIYLSEYQQKESNAGITLHRDTIFIFKKALVNLTGQISTLNQLERSTLMHEWGHLLGVEHVSNPKCIMSEFVEVEQISLYRDKDIPTEYCPGIIQELTVQSKRFLK